MPATSIDEYELVRELGRGGMGIVHLARDTLLGRDVAIKFLRDSVSPTAEARFIREARAMAQIDHPNVVRVYRAGAVDGTPFLVTELLDGEALSHIERPVSLHRAWRFGLELAKGLGAAHRAGLLHRDVKLNNIVLTASGRLKLIDFGLAKGRGALEDVVSAAAAAPPRQSAVESTSGTATLAPGAGGRPVEAGDDEASDDDTPDQRSVALGTPDLSLPGRIAGTPRYLAPELWRGEAATPAADVFAAGVVLFELLTGEPPYDHADARDLELGQTRKARKLAEVADVPPAWSDLVATCLHPDPTRRFADGEALHRALIALAPASGDGDADGDGCPYPGLDAFSAARREQFFGRARETAAIEDRLRERGAAFVVGDSGVGKSSVCLAGVLPRLAKSGWGPLLAFRPGVDPAANLRAAAAARGLELAPDVAPSEAAAALVELSRAGSWTRPVLFVDQGEELVTLASNDQAGWLARTLAAFVHQGGALLACLRSDCLGPLAALAELGPLVGDGVVALGPLSREGLREAIVAPAAARGVSFADPALVDELVNWAHSSPGSLPLLQFALFQMWQQLDGEDRILGRDTLDAVGGVSGALSRYADSVIDALPKVDADRARQLLLALIDADGRRQIRAARELESSGDQAFGDRVLDHLVASRLVVRQGTGAGAGFTIAHEVLATRWPRLAHWRAEHDDDLRARDQLRRAAEQWRAQERDPGLLWRGARLLRARELGAAPGLEAEFVGASVRRIRRVWLARGVAVVAAALAALGLWQLSAWRSAAETKALADADLMQARRSLADGRAAMAASFTERDRAIELFRGGERKQGEPVWDAWNEAAERAGRQLTDSARAVEAAIGKAPPQPATLTLARQITTERIQLARLRRQPELENELRARLASLPGGERAIADLDPPSSLSISWTDPGIARVEVWRFDQTREPWALEFVVDTSWPRPLSLESGSYVVVGLGSNDTEQVRVPVWLGRGAVVGATVTRPHNVPAGMVAIPEGPYWAGIDAPDDVRRTLAIRPPSHQRPGGAFLVSRTEVAFAQWIAFLESMTANERAGYMPKSDELARGMSIQLEQVQAGWQLVFQATSRSPAHTLRDGSLLRYDAGRRRDRTHPWNSIPVSGVSAAQARVFMSWLDQSKRVAGARFCTEDEWTRAARGADRRAYPTGNELDVMHANIDATYGRQLDGYGPNAVGLHPENASPYGVMDMAGNVAEIVRRGRRFSAAGGHWYQPALFAMVTTWQFIGEGQRSPYVGLRVCADYDGPISTVEVVDPGIDR